MSMLEEFQIDEDETEEVKGFVTQANKENDTLLHSHATPVAAAAPPTVSLFGKFPGKSPTTAGLGIGGLEIPEKDPEFTFISIDPTTVEKISNFDRKETLSTSSLNVAAADLLAARMAVNSTIAIESAKSSISAGAGIVGSAVLSPPVSGAGFDSKEMMSDVSWNPEGILSQSLAGVTGILNEIRASLSVEFSQFFNSVVCCVALKKHILLDVSLTPKNQSDFGLMLSTTIYTLFGVSAQVVDFSDANAARKVLTYSPSNIAEGLSPAGADVPYSLIIAQNLHLASHSLVLELIERMRLFGVDVDARKIGRRTDLLVIGLFSGYPSFPMSRDILIQFLCNSTVSETVNSDLQYFVKRLSGELPMSLLKSPRIIEDATKCISVNASISQYIRDVVVGVRMHPLVRCGPNLQGTLALETLSKLTALLDGTHFVRPTDVDFSVHSALAHRTTLVKPGHKRESPFAAQRRLISRIIQASLRPPK